jgi:hypothetical protein
LGAWLAFSVQIVAAPAGGTDSESLAAINGARAAMIDVLNNAPLGFRRILFVKEVPDRFGAYKSRGNTVFAPDEPLIIYTEPIGVAWKQDGDEYSSKLVVDFEIRSPDGRVLAGQKGFGDSRLASSRSIT